MTQLELCPKCQKDIVPTGQSRCSDCNWSPPRIGFHITPEAALKEMLQKAFWPKKDEKNV